MQKNNSPSAFDLSGIIVNDSISLSIVNPNANGMNKKMSQVFIALLGVLGTIFSFTSLFDFKYHFLPLAVFAVISCICFSLLYFAKEKLYLILLPAALVYIFAIINLWAEIENGYKAIFNKIADRYDLSASFYRLPKDIDEADCTTVLFFIVTVIVSFILCYITIVRPNFPIAFLTSFVMIEIGLFEGCVPNYLAFFMLLAFWISILAMHCSSSKYHLAGKKQQASFVRSGNSFFSVAEIKLKVTEIIGFFVIIAICISLITFSLSLSIFKYERPESIDIKREEMKSMIDNFSMDEAIDTILGKTGVLFDPAIITGNTRLGQFSELKYQNKKTMTVSIDEATQALYSNTKSLEPIDYSIYIKGRSYALYNGNEWKELDKSVYAAHSELFGNGNSFGELCSGQLQNLYGEFEINTVSTVNKYLYLPYCFMPDGGMLEEFVFDNYVTAANMQRYDFSVAQPIDYTHANYACQHIYNEFSTYMNVGPYEQKYRDFVYGNYLAVPDSKDIKQIKDKFPQVGKVDESLEYSDKLQQQAQILDTIKNILSENCDYTLSPGRTPKGSDFVNYFLLENKKGYCSHFASAGIIMSRMAGIPARYAEGFIIPDGDIIKAAINGNGMYDIDVLDKQAHAWAEIYIDGFGWIPYEFTAPYGSSSVNPQHTTVSTTTKAPVVTTTSPSTTKNDNSGGNAATSKTTTATKPVGGTVKNDNGGFFSSPMFRLLFYILLCTAVTILILVLRRNATLNKLNRKLREKSTDKCTSSAYEYILKLLKYSNIEQKNMMYSDFADFAAKNSPYIEKTEMHRITEIILKCAYSNHNISSDEANEVIGFSKALASKIFGGLSKSEQLYMKYVLNLY